MPITVLSTKDCETLGQGQLALHSSREVGGGEQLWQAKLVCKDRALASSRKAFLADVHAMETSWLELSSTERPTAVIEKHSGWTLNKHPSQGEAVTPEKESGLLLVFW